jgi:hypothetical protein
VFARGLNRIADQVSSMAQRYARETTLSILAKGDRD